LPADQLPTPAHPDRVSLPAVLVAEECLVVRRQGKKPVGVSEIFVAVLAVWLGQGFP
jgi:hypothetical protein